MVKRYLKDIEIKQGCKQSWYKKKIRLSVISHVLSVNFLL